MTMKKVNYSMIGATLLLLSVSGSTYAAAPDADNDGIPDISERLLHTDPLNADTDGDGINDLKDKQPVDAGFNLKTAGTESPVTIKEVLVEDNYDYVQRKDAPDHLELTLVNNSNQDLANVVVSYSIKSLDSKEVESYRVPLNNTTLTAHKETRIHFDDKIGPLHFRANPNSIYKMDQSAKVFNVSVDVDGFKSASASVKKDKGGAEQAD